MPECSIGDLDKRLIEAEKSLAALTATSEERDRRYSETIVSMREAVRVALETMEHRLNTLNELRQMVVDNDQHYARGAELNLIVAGLQSTDKAMQDRIIGLADLVHTQVTRGSGMRELMGWIVGGIATIAAVASAYTHLGSK